MVLKESTKKFLITFLKFSISIALLGYLYHIINVEKTVEALKNVDFLYIGYAALLFLGINMILLLRWYVLISALHLRIPVMSVARYFSLGLFGNPLLPSSVGGDFFKIAGLCIYTTQKAKVVASVILDRLSGFVGIIIVASISYAIAHRSINNTSLLIMTLILAILLAVAGIILFNEKIYTFCCMIFSRWPKIKENLIKLHYDVALLKGKYLAICTVVGLSCLAQILSGYFAYLLSKSLHQNISVFYFIIFTPFICVASSFPSVGGLGPREAAAVKLFEMVEVPRDIVGSIYTLNFFFIISGALLGGLIYLLIKTPDKKILLNTETVSI